MLRIFFDTETSGLPKNWKAPATDTNNWPRIVQLAYIVANDEEIIHEQDMIVKPVDFEISEEVSGIHGITQQHAMQVGLPIGDVLGRFISHMHDCATLVAHNINYDVPVITAEFHRMEVKDFFEGKLQICTMKSSTNFCAIPNTKGYGYKWPRLQELYKKLFNEEFDGAHNALNDIRATMRCFFELKRLGVIYERNHSIFKQLVSDKRK